MRKEISLGKIDFNGCGRKINLVTVDIELRSETTSYGVPYKEFSVCADVWNSKKTDILCGGQCLDDIKPYMAGTKYETLFLEIYDLWKKYHLNGFRAGTPNQQKACKEWFESNPYDWNKLCNMLKSKGIYEDTFTGYGHAKQYNNEPYRYGSDWVVEFIPEDDLAFINMLFV